MDKDYRYGFEFSEGDGRITITMPGGHQAHLKNGSSGCLVGISDPGMVAKAAEEGVDLDEMASYCPD